MHPRVKRYLRLRNLFEDQISYIHDEESFIQKYISLYPTHLDFEEIFDMETDYLNYFFRIPSKIKAVYNGLQKY